MRRTMVPRLLFAGLMALMVWGVPSGKAVAQAKDKEKEKDEKKEPATKSPAADASERVAIDTADGLRLQGVWYPGKKGKQSDTVILVHNVGAQYSMDKGNWTKLAETLWEADFSVLRFDMRGHGKSTNQRAIFNAKEFCDLTVHPQNKYSGAPVSNPKYFVSIDARRFSGAYIPYLLNDLMAVRRFIDIKNDEGTTNSGGLHFIGDRESCGLIMEFIGLEYLRNSVNPVIVGGLAEKSTAGLDVRSAVFLSFHLPSPIGDIFTKTMAMDVINFERSVVREPISSNVSLLFLNGESDPAAGVAKSMLNYFGLPNGKSEDKDKGKYFVSVPKSKATQGIDLLKPENDLSTEKTIVAFLEGARQKKLNGINWKARNANVIELRDLELKRTFGLR